MNLKEIRISKGLKQKRVAMDLNLNPVTYNGYETGKSEPSIEMIIKLAEYFNVTTDELLGAKREIINLSEKRNLLEKINKLTEAECFNLNIYADALICTRIVHKGKINSIIEEKE